MIRWVSHSIKLKKSYFGLSLFCGLIGASYTWAEDLLEMEMVNREPAVVEEILVGDPVTDRLEYEASASEENIQIDNI